MTFKHEKFENSSTMRSLIKVAQEKGWVKEETITKTASSTTDLSPTSSITENILKLCSGLRQSGLEKHAVELEDKLFAYKQAQTLYEAHKETGDDLVDQAHPKGSHKLENVDSDEAVIETIVEQHLKDVKMVNKKPTGKLTEASQILNAVKIVLSEDNTRLKEYYRQYDGLIKLVKENWKLLDGLIRSEGELVGRASTYNQEAEMVDKLLATTPMTASALKSLVKFLPAFMNDMKPGWSGGVSENIWPNVQVLVPKIIEPATKAADLILKIWQESSGVNTRPQAEDATSNSDDASQGVIDQYDKLIRDISLNKELLETENLPNAAALSDWLDKLSKFVVGFKDKYSGSQNKSNPSLIEAHQKQINYIKSKVDAFHQRWLQ